MLVRVIATTSCAVLTVRFMALDYVLQRALTVVEGEQKQALIASIRPQLMNMRRYSSTFSKHLTSSECGMLTLSDFALTRIQSSASLRNARPTKRRCRTRKTTRILKLPRYLHPASNYRTWDYSHRNRSPSHALV